LEADYKKRLPRIFLFLAAILILVKFMREKEASIVTNHITGLTMGTIPYSIKYKTKGPVDYTYSVDSLLKSFNQSLSTYIPDSEISRFNQNDTLVFESGFFLPILKASQQVYNATYQAFDPTVGPLVNAWGFGPGKSERVLAHTKVDSLLKLVGFDRIDFTDLYVTKQGGVYLDFSAIAKGYAIDLLADFLAEKKVTEYMIEIGGEVSVKGTNDKKNNWSIGIEDPLVNRDEHKLLAISQVPNRSMATSGNYRNYFQKDGKVYAHIIDPRTGYTSNKNILSATVFASECMRADAYATAFMVLGVDSALTIVNQNDDLEAFIIYQSRDSISIEITEGIKEDIILLETNK
jgi:thiamine biosynthesis lipoprotein